MPCVMSKSVSSPPVVLDGGRGEGEGLLPFTSPISRCPFARGSLLVNLFKKFCPSKTAKRLCVAYSSLVICSACNLLTPTLIGLAVDTAGGRGGAAGALGSAPGVTSASASSCIYSYGTSLLRGVYKVLGLVLFRGKGGEMSSEFFRKHHSKILLFLIGGVLCVGALTSCIRTMHLEIAEQEIKCEVRRQVFFSFLHMPPSFFWRYSAGQLLPLFHEDTESLAAVFCRTQAQALRYCSSVFGGGFLLFSISPRITTLAFLLLPLAGYSAMSLRKRLRHWQSFQEKEIQKCNSFLADRLIHSNTVYIHQEQEQEAYRLEEQQNKILQASHSSALVNGLFFGFLSFSVNATFLALLTYGMTLVKKGTLSYGNLTSFAVYSSMVGVGFSGLASLSSEVHRAVQAGSRINTVLNLVKELSHKADEREKERSHQVKEEKKKCPIGNEKKNDLRTNKDQHHTEEAVTIREKEEKGKEEEEANNEGSSCRGFLPFISSYEEREDKLEAENLLKNFQGEIKLKNVSFTYTSKNGTSKKTASSSSCAPMTDSPSSLAQVSTPQMIDLSPSLSDVTATTATTTSLDMSSSIVDSTPSAGNEKKSEYIDSSHLEEFTDENQTGKGEGMTGMYEEDEERLLSLKNISLSIPPGCITAITGQSGSGKTTLLKLLTKQINPTQGVIALDGTDLSVISTRVLLQKILGIVNPESSSLFSGLTIKENLFYGVWKKDSATGIQKSEEMAVEQKEVKSEASSAGEGQVSLTPFSRSMTACFKEHLFKEVCQLCNINGILENLTPAHENTRIEGSLSPFSSGEQQRLGLARALIKQPKILILDEATAHLDSHNERHFLQALRYLLKKQGDHSSSFPTVSEERKDEKDSDNGARSESCHPSLLGSTVHTIVVIAHSKEALQMADNIVVLKKGEIVETGSFKDLIQKESGELTRLLKKQQH